MSEKTVTLDPEESQEVVFQFIPDAPGVHEVRIDELSGSFMAVEFAAEFELDSLVIEPSQVEIGEPVTISCRVTNVGGKRGSKTVTLEVT